MRMRWVSLIVAALIMFVGIGAMATKGFNFALDFTGGVGIELRFQKAPDVDDIRTRLTRAGSRDIGHPAILPRRCGLRSIRRPPGTADSLARLSSGTTSAVQRPRTPECPGEQAPARRANYTKDG